MSRVSNEIAEFLDPHIPLQFSCAQNSRLAPWSGELNIHTAVRICYSLTETSTHDLTGSP